MYLVLKTDVFRLRFEEFGNAWEHIGDTLRDIGGNFPEVVDPKFRPNREDADNPNFRPMVGPLDVLAHHNLAFRIWDALTLNNTLFIGTSQGLFRFTDDWEKLPIPKSQGIKSLVTNKNNLYVGTMAGLTRPKEGIPRAAIFSSTNHGDSWTDVTPKNRKYYLGNTFEVVTAGDTLILSGYGFRSKDGGKTWIAPDGNPRRFSSFPVIALDDNTVYGVGRGGIIRSTDFGLTWYPFMNGIVNSHVPNLIVVKNVLYALTREEMFKSVDGGESWDSVGLRQVKDHVNFIGMQTKVAAANGVLYASNSDLDGVKFSRLSDDGKTFLPVEGVPDFEFDTMHTEWEIKQRSVLEHRGVFKNNVDVDKGMEQRKSRISNIMNQWNAAQPRISEELRTNGTFIMSDDTVFMEYRHKLFRWRFGETEWHDTGLEDLDERSQINAFTGYTLAVSGNTVYAGKRGGDLFLSEDSGDTWIDVTENLAFHGLFKEIMFADSTVYVSTNMGVMSSNDGETWHVLNGDDGDILIIDRIAVDGATVYGVNDSGIYQADNQTHSWKQIAPKLPYIPTSFALDSDTFYIGTKQNGVFRIHRPDQ